MELTDQRLDELATRVNEGFRQVAADTRELRYELQSDSRERDLKLQKLDIKLGREAQQLDSKLDREAQRLGFKVGDLKGWLVIAVMVLGTAIILSASAVVSALD